MVNLSNLSEAAFRDLNAGALSKKIKTYEGVASI